MNITITIGNLKPVVKGPRYGVSVSEIGAEATVRKLLTWSSLRLLLILAIDGRWVSVDDLGGYNARSYLHKLKRELGMERLNLYSSFGTKQYRWNSDTADVHVMDDVWPDIANSDDARIRQLAVGQVTEK